MYSKCFVSKDKCKYEILCNKITVWHFLIFKYNCFFFFTFFNTFFYPPVLSIINTKCIAKCIKKERKIQALNLVWTHYPPCIFLHQFHSSSVSHTAWRFSFWLKGGGGGESVDWSCLVRKEDNRSCSDQLHFLPAGENSVAPTRNWNCPRGMAVGRVLRQPLTQKGKKKELVLLFTASHGVEWLQHN